MLVESVPPCEAAGVSVTRSGPGQAGLGRDENETNWTKRNFPTVVSRETKGAPTLPSTLSSPQQGPGGLGQAETPAVANADVGTK